MYGYIYMTTNSIDSSIYIGKKALPKFRPTYHGAGKYIKAMTKQYGSDIFTTVMLDEASNEDELNYLEKYYIEKYKSKYGNDCVNIASGGDGGNVFSYASEERKREFSETMTKINKQRTNTTEFKEQARKRMIARYQDPAERKRHGEKVKATWSNPKLKEEQSIRLKEYYKKNGGKDCSFNFKRCLFVLGDKQIEFESIKALKAYLKDEYGITFANPAIKDMLTSEKPYIPFHKNKPASKALYGMVLKYIK